MRLRTQRTSLSISQSRLSRLASVSRFKICVYELGSGSLTAEEHARIREALLSEVNRLRSLAASIDSGAQGAPQ